MSSTNPQHNPPAPATVTIVCDPDIFPVELLDASLRPLQREFGRLNARIAPGLYLARCEIGGAAVERTFKIDSGEAREIRFSGAQLDRLASSAPVLGSRGRNQYYSAVATQLQDVPPNRTGFNTRLVLLATRFGADPFEQRRQTLVSWGNVKLRNQYGNAAVRLDSDHVDAFTDPEGRIFAALIVEAPIGGYFLEWPSGMDGDAVHLQPIWLAEGWTTTVFASVVGNETTPRRETVSIHLTPLGRGPEPDFDRDYVNAAAELGLASLRTGRRQLGDEQLAAILHAKFENPMLGILGAYTMLRQSLPNLGLLNEVLNNLKKLVGDHPDVSALRALSHARWPQAIERPDQDELHFPPMLTDGLFGLAELEWSGPRFPLGVEGNPGKLWGIARLARLRALPSGPWTTFWHDDAELYREGYERLRHSELFKPTDWGPAFLQLREHEDEFWRDEMEHKPVFAFDPQWLPVGQSTRPTVRLPRLLPYVAPVPLAAFGPTLRNGTGSLLATAAYSASNKALRSLRDYLKQIPAQSVVDLVFRLRTEHFSWTGLSPWRVLKLLRQMEEETADPTTPGLSR